MTCPSFASFLALFPERGRREDRVPAGTRGPCAEHCASNAQGRTTGEAGNNPAFPAQWVDGLWRALLGDEFVLASVAPRIDDAVRPGWADASPRKLDCSNDSQDHTLLPYAPAPFVCAMPIAHGSTRPAIASRADAARVHRIPTRVS